MGSFKHLQSSAVNTVEDASSSSMRIVVRDLDTAIYIYMRSLQDPELGIRIEDAVKVGPARHDVIFSDEKGLARVLEVEFANSPAAHFANAQRSLKRLIRRYDPHARTGGRRG